MAESGNLASGAAGTERRPPVPHDQFFKRVFEQSIAVVHLLLGFVQAQVQGGSEWFGRLDFGSMEALPTERIDPELRRYFGDKIWRIRFLDDDGAERWMYVVVILEFQSRVDWFMALRMQGFAVRFYEGAWRERRPIRADRLPPVLGIVVYNGKPPWTAATRMTDLVGPGTRPAAAGQAGMPTWTGDSYVVIDLGRYEGSELPGDNVVSLLALARQIKAQAEVPDVIERAVTELRGPEREGLLVPFLRWFRQVLGRGGFDLDFLEDRDTMAALEQAGTLLPTIEERVQEWKNSYKAEGVAEGRVQMIAHERDLLRRLAEVKFGTETAGQLARLVAMIDDPSRLSDIGTWIVSSGESAELLERLRTST